jgi:hypothetical protein
VFSTAINPPNLKTIKVFVLFKDIQKASLNMTAYSTLLKNLIREKFQPIFPGLVK